MKRAHIALVATGGCASLRKVYSRTALYLYTHLYIKYIALNILIVQMLYWLLQANLFFADVLQS